MKKLFLLLILTFTTNIFGQTYSFNLKTGVLCNTCWDPNGPPGPTYDTFTASSFSWNIKNNGITVASNAQSGYVPNGTSYTPYSNVTAPLNSTFSISILSTGQVHYGGTDGTCNTDNTTSKSLENLIIDGSMGFSDSPCGINALITIFKPNVTIQNNNSDAICSGEQLNLVASSGFPNAAYHWQYSKDNQITWIDVPLTIGTTNTNNTPQTYFSINDLLGDTSEQYFNKQIYFRLGYGQNRPFSNVIPITFSPCAPVIKSIVYEGPQCSGDILQKIEVIFDRNLKLNESIFPLYILDTDTSITTPFCEQKNRVTSLTLDPITNKYKYSFIELNRLISGHSYVVKYQAFFNTTPMGVIQSTDSFTYTEIAPITFDVTKTNSTKTNILCKGKSTGSITVQDVNGGNGGYSYSNDGGTTWQSSPTFLNLPAGTYSIKIKDQLPTPCTSVPVDIILSEPNNAITLTNKNLNSPTGFAKNNGSIDISVTGGSGNLNYTWTNNLNQSIGSSNTISNLTAGNYYYTVIDDNACFISDVLTLTQPFELTVSISGNSISCHGDTTTLSAIAQGGIKTTEYTYQWQKYDGSNYTSIPDKTDANPSGMSAGKYKVIVYDNAYPTNSATSSEFELTENSQITVSPTLNSALCNGDNGSVSLAISNGIAPYTIDWTGTNKDTAVITNNGALLTGKAGIYYYNVTDALGCKLSNNPIAIDILEPTQPLTHTISSTSQPTAPNYNNGLIAIIANGGTSNYKYVLKKDNITTDYSSNIITNLDEGTYEVWTEDSNGCTSAPETIKLEALKVSLIATNNIKCYSDATGNITVSASGGTLITNTSYSYKWFKNGSEIIGQTNSTINGLTYGDYFVQITDDKTTIQSPTYTLTQPSNPLTVTSTLAQQHNQTCSDKIDGAIEITVSGGTGAYKYAWSNSKTTKDISGLFAGTYSVIVTDGNSCTKTLIGIEITQPFPITPPQESITPVLINGQSTGAINFSQEPTGGNGGYTYKWVSSSDATFITKTTKNLSGLKAGFYTLEIKDTNQCSVSKTFEITESPLLQVSTKESSAIKCNGNFDGELQAIVTGGIATYNYQWFKNGIAFGDNSFEQKGLEFGDYKVIVTDFVGATKTTNLFTLKQPDLLTVTTTVQTNVLCNNANTGAIDITINGGTAPYTQQWTKEGLNYSTNKNLINLGTGTYQVAVTDAVGHNCTASLSPAVIITQPTNPLAINDLDVKNLTGFETLNGSIKVQITGGTTPYNYTFGNQSNVTIAGNTLLIDKLSIGSYTLMIADANGCTISKDYILLQPEELKINSVTQTDVIRCNGDKTAILEATVTGGRPIGTLDSDKNYIYNWYNTTDLTNPVSTSNPATGLGAGIYRLIVSDGTDILKNTITSNDITIIEPAPIQLTYTKTNTSCKGESDATIQINVTGGSGNYNLIWSYNTDANKDKTDITDLSAGNYNVKVIDKNDINCFKEYTITIDEPENALAFNPEKIVNASGFGLSNGNITLDITGGRPPYTYKWYKGNTADSNNSIQNATTNALGLLEAGFYTTQVEDTNPFGTNCVIIKTFEIKQPNELTLSVLPTIAYCNNGKGSIQAAAIGGSEIEELQNERIYTYILLDVNDNPLQTLKGNTANFVALVSGNYKVIAIDSKNNKTIPFLVTLDQPTPIDITLTSKENVTCFNGNDGSLTINVKGGTPLIENNNPVYTYEWKKDGVVINMNNNLSPTSLKSGTYSVTVFDGNYNSNDPNFCIGTLENIIITQPADFGFDLDKIVPTVPTAINTFDGALHIEIVGGVSPYTYVCTDSKNNIIETKTSIPNKQADFLSLKTDNYTIAVTDATGCTKSTTFDFNNTILTISSNQTNQVTCNNGTDATLNALVNGGFGVKTISWYKNNVVIPNETSATLTNVGIGTYYAVVKDFNKVEVTSNTTIVAQPNAINVTTTQNEVSCIGFNDGIINLSATGGSNIFNYRFRVSGNPYSSWVPFEKTTNATISNLKAGVYNIQIQDNNGCNYTSNLDITLSEPKQLNIAKSIITPTTGFNVANGSIAITAQGGNGGYLYKWFDNANTQLNQTTSTLTNVLAGKYYVIITDNKGCQFTSPLFEITQPDKLLVTISQFNIVLCNGDTNASLKTTTTGGIAGYTYQWFNNNSAISLGTGASLPSIGAGTYYVIVSDSKNNITKSSSFIVSEPALLNNILTSQYIRCGDANDWAISSKPTGGTSPYTYLWNTGAQTSSLQNVLPANYSVLVTDNHGCTTTQNITVIAPNHLATTETITKPTCFEGSDATIVLSSTGGQIPYTYLWNTGEQSNVLSNASAKEYTVAVTDFKGCVINKTYTIENPPKDIINLGEDVTLCFDQSLTINSTIADDKAKYFWTSTKGFTSDKPIITVSEAADYTLVVTNKLGCKASDILKIESQNTAINAEFAVSSQVFLNEKFIIVDISNPIADSIEWILPSEATVVSKNKDYAELSFNKVGEYELTLNTKKGNCTANQTKKIVVVEGEYANPDSTDLKKKFDLKIYPNPSNGIFTVDVTLDKVMPAHIKVYNLTNNMIIDSKYEEGKDAYKFNFNLSGLPSGVYFVLVESQQGNQLRKVIIQ